jgi:AAHS family 4-hydroxybenzoate transporter-like MFS transporter
MQMGAFAPAFSLGLLGAAIGALTFGGLGDRFGRKRTLILATLLMSVFTFLTAGVTSFPELLVVRFFAGLGLGGATPCFIALAAEYSPKRRRAMLTSILWAAYPLGAGVGGILNAYVIPHLGWQAVFYIGGGLPLLAAGCMAALLPESLSYLVTRGKSPDQALSIATRLDRTLQSRAIQLYARTGSMTAVGVSQLFTEGRGTSTMLLWATMFAAFGTTTVIVLLTPTLFRASGLSLSTAALLVGLHNFVGIAGMASSGRLIERFGPFSLVPAFGLGALILAALGTVASSATLSAICMTLLALTVLVGASGGIALAATSYPTEIRSTGVGWAMGMARFGQVCSPLIVGLMLHRGWDAARILAVMALLPFLAGAFCGAGRLYERAAPAGEL